MISAIALVLLVRDRCTISIFCSAGSGRSFEGNCCAVEQLARRQMVVRTVNDRTVMRVIVLKTSTFPGTRSCIPSCPISSVLLRLLRERAPYRGAGLLGRRLPKQLHSVRQVRST